MTTKKLLFCLFALSSLLSFCAEKTAYTVLRSALPPRLDGKIDSDPAWKNIPWSEPFTLHRKKSPPKSQTRFKALYCDDALYLAAECREKEMGKLRKVYNFTEFWNYDCVEAFFSLGRNELLHFAVNPDGMKSDEIPGITSKRTSFRTGWLGAAVRNKESWTLEMCIPFHLLGKVPSIQRQLEIPFNLCRFSTPEKERSTWSFQSGPFNNTLCFGTLVFAAPPDRDTAERLNDALSVPHYSSLVRRYGEMKQSEKFKPLLKRFPEETGEIESIVKDPERARKEFRKLSAMIAKIEKSASDGETGEISEVVKILFGE